MISTIPTILQKIRHAPPQKVLLVLLAITLPFDRVPTYQLFGVDLKISSVIGLALIFIATVRCIKNPKKAAKRLAIFLPLLLWLVWGAAGLIWAQDNGAFLRSFLPLAFLSCLAAAITLLWEKEYKKAVLGGLLAGSLLTIGFGIFQFIGNFLGLSDAITLIRPEYSWQGFGFPRLHSFSLEPLYFAGYLLLPIACVAAWLLKKGEVSFKQWRPLGYLAVGASIVILTLSRGGIAGLAVEVLFISILMRKELKKILSWRLIAGLVIGFVLSIGLVLGVIAIFNKQGNDSDLTYGGRGIKTFVSHLGNTRFFADKNNKEKDDSIAQRDTARSQGVEVIKSDYRILIRGTGMGQYGTHAKERYGVAYKGEPNNLVIEQLAQGGIIGFALLVSFFIALLRVLYKTRVDWLAVALFGYVAAILVQAQTFHGLAITHFWFAIGLAAGTAFTYSPRRLKTASAKHPRTSA